MIDLVLDDLRGEAGERLLARLEASVLEAHLDGAVARCAAAARKRQAALLGLVRARAADDLRVEHDARGTLVVEDDDALGRADHVGRHADALVGMRRERVEQVLRRLGVGCHGGR